MSTRKISVALLIGLLISSVTNIYLSLQLEKSEPVHHHSTFFSFMFSPTMQKISENNLYLNLTFDTFQGNLTVKAEVGLLCGTLPYSEADAVLALQFDSDNNGTIDIRQFAEDEYVYFFQRDDLQFLCEASNKTLPAWYYYWGWLADGTLYMLRSPPFSGWAEQPSSFHYCVYQNRTLTFQFSFPIEATASLFGDSGRYGIKGKIVRVLFGIADRSKIDPSNPNLPKEMCVYVPPFIFEG